MASWISKARLEADLMRLAEKMLFWRRRGSSLGRIRMAIRKMSDSFLGGVGWMQGRRSGRKKKTSFRAGWALFGIIAAVGMYAFYRFPPLGLVLWGVDLLYLGTCLHEVKAPNRAFLFRMGKMIGDLPPGWYLTIPHFWTIEAISMEAQQIGPLTEEMYIRRGTPITVRIVIFYRVVNLTKALLTKNIIKDRIRAVVLTQVKGKIGESFFRGPRRVDESEKNVTTLLTERGSIEKAIKEVVNEELRLDGYFVTGIELEDIKEEVESEAATIRQIGHARGDAAAALAKPLKDNYPAAAVSAVGTIGEMVERIFRGMKSSGGSGGGKQPGSETPVPEKSELGKIADALTKLTERR